MWQESLVGTLVKLSAVVTVRVRPYHHDPARTVGESLTAFSITRMLPAGCLEWVSRTLPMSGEEVAEGEAQQRQYDNRVEPLIHRDPLAISWAAASRP